MSTKTDFLPIALSLLPLSPQEALKLEQELPSLQYLSTVTDKDLSHILNREITLKSSLQEILAKTYSIIDKIEFSKINYITLNSSLYPLLLREIYSPPYLLYIKGEMSLLNSSPKSLVGSRRSTNQGEIDAFTVGLTLGVNKISLITGGASGIDTSATLGNLKGGGKPIVVAGCGLEYHYPKENKALYTKIIENGGCLVSELPPDYPPRAFNFPKRNRLISGMVMDILAVDFPVKSGTMTTVNHALEQGRDVYAIGDSQGARILHEQGAPWFKDAKDFISYSKFHDPEIIIDWNNKDRNIAITIAERMKALLSNRIVEYHGKSFLI